MISLRLSLMTAASVLTLAQAASAQTQPQPQPQPQPQVQPQPQPPPGYGYPPGYAAPPGYAYPPAGAYPYAVPVPAPGPRRELAYDDGAPIPAGYHVESRTRKGLVIGGAVTFGAVYLLNVIGAASAQSSGGNSGATAFYVPVAGPFIALGNTHHDDIAVGLERFSLVLDGLAQTAGAAMLIAGLASSKSVLVPNQEAEVKTPLLKPQVNAGVGAASLKWKF